MSQVEITRLLKRTIGLDPEAIGSSAIERAIAERQTACRLQAAAYWAFVGSSEEERQALIDAVVVPETWFFRNREAFLALAQVVLQRTAASGDDRPLRILSVPCSSGEEPYSIAMALHQAAVDPNRFDIDAADVSERLLVKARRAVYGQNSFRGDDVSFRDRYFETLPSGYQLASSVRGLVRFQRGNLLSPVFMPGAEPYDLVFCRNLFIYFDRPTQRQALESLTRLLREDGLLFVGSSETGVPLDRQVYVNAGLPMAFAFARRSGPPPAERAERPSVRRRRRAAAIPPAEANGVERTAGLAGLAADGLGTRPASGERKEPADRHAIEEACQLADRGYFAEAAERCEGHLRREGPSAPALYLLGLVRDAAGLESEAEALYRKTLYLNPDHREALVQLALLLDRQGRHADALLLRQRVDRVEAAGGVVND